ncbi:hypothetical protein FY528_13230 [Hymenobacter lutimineralis]|uniref:DUF6989 domain-containing protein n=1 Tax=Hymenobacter lutimineralis TaxID=2606448 RepID=A0A5D6UZC8_9BACT|nr:MULTISPECIES: hypothetical protein [Hymenobacter]QIX59839.1 hypothetical protein HER32_00990 [Hymenobacter sp. BT18]TYZ08405.1 hypothetical protein FY528_13230 [Hymenobacter lutimineralis]
MHPTTTLADRTFPYRTPVMLGLMTLGILLLIHDSLTHQGWISAARWSYGLFAAYLLYASATRDVVIGRLLAFALVAGLAELVADAYLVSFTKTLLYPRPEPMLWDSPLYMPVSWAVVLTQIGYLGWLLLRWMPASRAGLLLVPVSGLLIPLYENWAIRAGWWNYQGAPELWGVPYYIYLAEALLMLPVPWLLVRALGQGGRWLLLAGLLEGLVMLLACIVAFTLVG